MTSQRKSRRLPSFEFRVLIIGRANAGKTSILQRVCETTDSPKVYRVHGGKREEVQLDPTTERGKHNIHDELIFTNHLGYIFHDSRGFECGSEEELKIVQDFIHYKSTAKRLRDRLHAIWYCIPMDNQRPSLDLKYINVICPDKNVPVIAIFTKYDQFKRNIKMQLEDNAKQDAKVTRQMVDNEAEKVFQREYLVEVQGTPTYVQLEKMHKHNSCCSNLIFATANALNNEVVEIMLLAVQRGNLEPSVQAAVKRACYYLDGGDKDTIKIIKICILRFPYIWLDEDELESLLSEFLEESEESSLFLSLLFSEELSLLEEFKLLSSSSESSSSSSSSKKFSSINKQAQHLCFFIDQSLSEVCDNPYHIMIVMILILEQATLFIASSDSHTWKAALQEACSQFVCSGTLPLLQKQFLSSMAYDSSQYTKFILEHPLSLL